MVQVIKKSNESTLSLLKRFSRKVKESGNIPAFKNHQFKHRKKSDLKKKTEALKKANNKKRMQKLYKMGKIDHLPK